MIFYGIFQNLDRCTIVKPPAAAKSSLSRQKCSQTRSIVIGSLQSCGSVKSRTKLRIYSQTSTVQPFNGATVEAWEWMNNSTPLLPSKLMLQCVQYVLIWNHFNFTMCTITCVIWMTHMQINHIQTHEKHAMCTSTQKLILCSNTLFGAQLKRTLTLRERQFPR